MKRTSTHKPGKLFSNETTENIFPKFDWLKNGNSAFSASDRFWYKKRGVLPFDSIILLKDIFYVIWLDEKFPLL